MLSISKGSEAADAIFVKNSHINVYSMISKSNVAKALGTAISKTDTLFHREFNKPKTILFMTQESLVILLRKLVSIHKSVILPMIVADDCEKLWLLLPSGSFCMNYVLIRCVVKFIFYDAISVHHSCS